MDGPWSVRAYIDSATGKTYRIYKFDKKPCRRVRIESRLCDHLAGYTLMEKDLRSAISWISLIESKYSDVGQCTAKNFLSEDRGVGTEIKALFVAALTFYGKCFTSCEGRPVKLDRGQLELRYRDMHDFCMSLRHNFAAHSGAAKTEYVKVVVVVPEKAKKGRRVPLNLYTELAQPDYMFLSSVDSISWAELFEHARLVAKKKCETLTGKILQEEVLPKGGGYWVNK